MSIHKLVLFALTPILLLGGAAAVVADRLSTPAQAAAVSTTVTASPAAIATTSTTDQTDQEAAGVQGDDQLASATALRTRTEAALSAAIAGEAADGSFDVAVALVDHNTGTTYTYDGDSEFTTASIVKVDILATLLLQAQQDGRQLTSAERNLATDMIENSDNDAASSLWSRIGGVSGLDATSERLGLTATTPGSDGYWGMTTTTAADQAKLLDGITAAAGPLDTDSSAYLLELMGDVAADQSWGVSAAAETGENVALKNGWVTEDDNDGRWAVNGIGRITDADTDVTLVVLSRGHSSMSDGVAAVERDQHDDAGVPPLVKRRPTGRPAAKLADTRRSTAPSVFTVPAQQAGRSWHWNSAKPAQSRTRRQPGDRPP